MRSRGPRLVATFVLFCVVACRPAVAPVPPPPADGPTGEHPVEPEPEPERSEPEAPPPSIAIQYPRILEVPSGAVAASVGPVDGPQQYCDAYMATAPPRQQYNATISVDSECTVLREPTSDVDLSPAAALPALSAPYLEVLLLRTRAPYDYEEGKEETWDDFVEIRVAIDTERGTFVEERGIEIANYLPASAVAIRKATVEDVVTGGVPELRIVLELFIGADEGVPEQYQTFELVCGFGASGRFACARFESEVKTYDPPRSPVKPEALRALVLP
jgi:hypothetical protein